MQATKNQVEEVLHNAFAVAVGVGVEPCDTAHDASAEDIVWSRIDVTGSWTGEVAIGCGDALVRLAAAALFGNAPSDVTTADAADVAMELINVVGGNLAPLLGDGCRIHLPALGCGDGANAQFVGHYSVAGAPLIVRATPTA